METLPLELQLGWFMNSFDANVAILTTGMVLIDVDDAGFVVQVLREVGDTPHKVVTPYQGVLAGLADEDLEGAEGQGEAGHSRHFRRNAMPALSGNGAK